MKSEFIKNLDWNIVGGIAKLIKLNNNYYRISYVPIAFDTGCSETLAFKCDEDGKVKDWTDVAGGKYKSIEETISELEENGEQEFVSGLATIESGLNAIINSPPSDYYVNANFGK